MVQDDEPVGLDRVREFYEPPDNLRERHRDP